jgi:hypothetical protein
LFVDAKEQQDPPNGLNQTITSLTTMEMLQSSLVQKITRSQMDVTTTSTAAIDRDRQTESTTVTSAVHYTTMKPCGLTQPKLIIECDSNVSKFQ